MKSIIYTLACMMWLLVTNDVAAQAPGIQWSHEFPQYIVSLGSVAEQAHDGGYIVGSTFASHFLVFKLDSSGTKVWDRFITSNTGLVFVNAVKPTSDNGYIVAGSDMAAGSDTLGNHGMRDFMVAKLNDTGGVAWIRDYGGSSNEVANSIEQTSDSGYIVAGFTYSSDSDVTSVHGSADYWVVKLNAGGHIEWQKTYGGSNYDNATSIVPTSDGGYIVAGSAQSKDGDVTGTHWGTSDDDVWVVKLDATGSIVWQKSYGGSGADVANSIRQTSDGGYIVAGNTGSPNDGNVTGRKGGLSDYWILKLDASGNLSWQKCLGGSKEDDAYSIRQISDGNYVIGGTVISDSSNNGDITGYHGITGSDYWVVKMDTTGTIIWEKTLGGTGTEDMRSVTETTDGGFIVAGSTQFSGNGDVNASDPSNIHPWIVKLLGNSTGVPTIANEFSFVAYPNPAHNKLTINNIPLGAVLSLTDITGKRIYRTIAQHMQEQIDVSNLANGTYFIRVEADGEVANGKIVVCR